MSTQQTDAERMREVGLFDLPQTLPELLKAVADFFERHDITEPETFQYTKVPNRGWAAQLHLTPRDYLRVTHGYPLAPVSTLSESGSLLLTTELRAGTVSTTVALDELTPSITADGILFSVS